MLRPCSNRTRGEEGRGGGEGREGERGGEGNQRRGEGSGGEGRGGEGRKEEESEEHRFQLSRGISQYPELPRNSTSRCQAMSLPGMASSLWSLNSPITQLDTAYLCWENPGCWHISAHVSLVPFSVPHFQGLEMTVVFKNNTSSPERFSEAPHYRITSLPKF